MNIVAATITYIREDGEAPRCTVTERDAGLNQLLELHMTRLKERAAKDTSLPCVFIEPSAQHRAQFERLSSGSEQDFLDAASQLALQVQQGMKGNSKEGLFVALKGNEENAAASQPFAAILKLEVVDPVGGYLREVDDDRRLATVKRLLVRPKELQKGAYYPDPRPQSEVIVGDTVDKAALYFLRGLGLTQEMAPNDAVAFLTKRVVQRFPLVDEEELFRRLERSKAQTAEAFVNDNADLLPEADARAALIDDFAAQARPVRTINTAAPKVTRRELIAGAFKVTFPPSARAQLTVTRRESDQQWETLIVTPDEPKFT